MKNETNETKFDEIDELIASALADESSWPVPRAGFEERCERRVAEIMNEKKARRAAWRFGGGAAWMKVAAVFVAILGFAAAMLSERRGGEDEAQDTALVAAADGTKPVPPAVSEQIVVIVEEEEILDDRSGIEKLADASLPKTPTARTLRAICALAASYAPKVM